VRFIAYFSLIKLHVKFYNSKRYPNLRSAVTWRESLTKKASASGWVCPWLFNGDLPINPTGGLSFCPPTPCGIHRDGSYRLLESPPTTGDLWRPGNEERWQTSAAEERSWQLESLLKRPPSLLWRRTDEPTTGQLMRKLELRGLSVLRRGNFSENTMKHAYSHCAVLVLDCIISHSNEHWREIDERLLSLSAVQRHLLILDLYSCFCRFRSNAVTLIQNFRLKESPHESFLHG